MKKNKLIKNVVLYIIVYTLVFYLIYHIGYMVFHKNSVSFILRGDGYSQHFPTLVYLGKYYRGVLWNFIHGNISIPLYDFNLGTGENIIGVLNYYGLGDIWLLSALFATEENAEFLYKLLIIFRMYFCGLSFSYFCIYMKKPRMLTLVGSISYVFCGFAVFSGIRHPYFLNPMIMLPLMFIGIEKIFKNKKPFLFIITIFLSALSGFYFFYMETVMIFIYAIIRYVALYRKESWLYFIKKAGQTILFYTVGVCLSGVLLLPALELLRSSSRINNESIHLSVKKLLFYSPMEYGQAYVNFISGPATWSCMGMIAITMIAVVVLFCKKWKEYRTLQVGCVIGFLFLLIPLGGYILNGFTYIVNRWSFGFAFLLAYVITTMIPSLINLSKIEIILTGISTIVYSLVVVFLARKYSPVCVFAMGVLWLFYIACLILSFFNRKQVLFIVKVMFEKIALTIILVLAIINCIGNIKITCDTKYDNYVNEFRGVGTGLSKVRWTAELLNKIDDNRDFYRVDATNRSHVNEGMVAGYNGVSGYFSLLNGNIPSTLWELKCSPSMYLPHKIEGLDERTILETLLSTRYLTTINSDNVPYGFKKVTDIKKDEKLIELYENQYVLPFGYTYTYLMPKEEYQEKAALEKQEAMLQAGVISNAGKNFAAYKVLDKRAQLTDNVQNLACSLEFENVSWKKDGTLQVHKKNGKIKVTFKNISNSETYLLIRGLDSNPSGIDKMTLKIESGSILKKFKVTSENYNWYMGRQEYMINLGYSKDGKKSTTICFPEKGEFKLDDIQVCAYTFTDYEKQVNELKKESLENVVFDTNKVSGTIQLSEPKLLCMSMEYDKGWSVYVDGKETETCMVNGMFLGVMLEEGSHQIECVYRTPGLIMGIIVSLLGVIGSIIIKFCYR